MVRMNPTNPKKPIIQNLSIIQNLNTMNNEINTAMTIARNFSETNLKAKIAAAALKEMNFVGTTFITPGQKQIIDAALTVLSEIQSKTTYYEAMQYFDNTQNESKQ